MDHARSSAGLVTQSGGAGHQHASVSEADLPALRAPHIKSSSPSNPPSNPPSMPSPTSSSHSSASHSSLHPISNPKSPSSTTQHLTAFNPSDPKTLSTEPTNITSTSTSSLFNNDSHLALTEASPTSISTPTSAPKQANTELNCERRRPEEEDTQRRLTMSSQLMSKTVTPFLKDHIPDLYSPLAKRDTIALMQRQNKDPNSRYCYRHRPDSKCRRAADESKMVNIQRELEKLKPDDQQAITHVWSLFSAAPSKQRDLMLQGIMTQCCFPQLSKVSREVADQLKIDFISALPPEVAYKILCYLDPLSLCKAAAVSRQWRALADDDQVWYRMCEQHIDRKCTKCGFGLPLLERKRLRDWTRIQQLAKNDHMHIEKPRIPTHAPTLPAPISLRDTSSLKRDASDFLLENIRSIGSDGGSIAPGAKRHCKAITASPPHAVAKAGADTGTTTATPHDCHDVHKPKPTEKDMKLAHAIEQERKPRAWKDVYRDRFRVGNNWRNGRCEVKVFRGHSNGVTCLQIDDVMMATGSYDATIRIWNLDTGEQTRVLRGHTQGIRSLQFDDKILVSGSLDGTMKIWNWHTGELLNTLVCHQSGVISVHLDGEWLASGSADKTIKVFNYKTKESFTLKGHSDWVNQVRIDTASRTIFSASDDCKVKLWDLESKRCIRTFEGHVGHVQQVLTLPADFEPDDDPETSGGGGGDATSVASNGGGRGSSPSRYASPPPSGEDYTRDAYGPGFIDQPDRPLPCRYILSSALDSTIKCWDTVTGKCVRTFFGHLEGVWALAGDTLRVVSGANDTMVKVWEPRSGKCEQTWTGHRGPVTCVGLSDSRLASGSEDGEVRLYSFQDRAIADECGTPS